MSLRSWIEKLVTPSPRIRTRKGRRHEQRPKRWTRPWLEALENRLAPAIITVTSPVDFMVVDGNVSLREAILSVNGFADFNADVTPNRTGSYGSNDTIVFSSSLTYPATITLTNISGTTLTIKNSVKILGRGADFLTVNGNNTSGVFAIVAAGGNVTISGLKITGGGNAMRGAGLYVGGGTVTLTGDDIEFNNATSSGGGIFATSSSSLSLSNSTLANNSAYNFGAGIEDESSTLTITNSTIANNHILGNVFPNAGSGIDTAATTTSLESCTLSGNTVQLNTQTADLYVFGGGTATLHNTILNGAAGNPAGTPNATTFGGPITSLGHNISSDGTGNLTGPGDFPNTNPFLDAFGLGPHGGATPTIPTLFNSPAIDNGDPGLGAPVVEQRGARRGATSGFGSMGNAGINPDIGAFEQSSLYVVTISDT